MILVFHNNKVSFKMEPDYFCMIEFNINRPNIFLLMHFYIRGQKILYKHFRIFKTKCRSNATGFPSSTWIFINVNFDPQFLKIPTHNIPFLIFNGSIKR